LPLSKERLDQLRSNDSKIEKYRETMKKKASSRLEKVREKVDNKIRSLNEKEIFLMGLFLYLGEGKKGYREALSISNTDPKIIKFAYKWMTCSLGVNPAKIRVSLHLYKDMNKEREVKYWSNLLKLPVSQFYEPYIKDSKLTEGKHAGCNHGTCNIAVCNVRLKEEVLISIEVAMNDFLRMRV